MFKKIGLILLMAFQGMSVMSVYFKPFFKKFGRSNLDILLYKILKQISRSFENEIFVHQLLNLSQGSKKQSRARYYSKNFQENGNKLSYCQHNTKDFVKQ